MLNETAASSCIVCGWVKFERLTLRSPVSGREFSLNIDTKVGKSTLKSVVGEDARFASEVQFLLKRSEPHEGWILVHDDSAANPTHVNGVKAAPGGVRLQDGSSISIGVDRSVLKVQLG